MSLLRQHVAGAQAANAFGIGINDNTTSLSRYDNFALLFGHVRVGIRPLGVTRALFGETRQTGSAYWSFADSGPTSLVARLL